MLTDERYGVFDGNTSDRSAVVLVAAVFIETVCNFGRGAAACAEGVFLVRFNVGRAYNDMSEGLGRSKAEDFLALAVCERNESACGEGLAEISRNAVLS